MISKLRLPAQPLPNRTSSLDDAMRWAESALEFVRRNDILSDVELDALISDKVVIISTAFSGIGTPETANRMISAACAKHLARRPTTPTTPRPLSFQNSFAIEIDKRCQEELLIMEGGPNHVFEDILNFLPRQVRRQCDLYRGGKPATKQELKTNILNAKPLLSAWCVRHGCRCKLASTDLHEAGSPCTDASSFGLKRFMDGPAAPAFWTWVLLVRELQFRIILHENVPQFGDEVLRNLLGDLYIVVREKALICFFPVCIHVGGMVAHRAHDTSNGKRPCCKHCTQLYH